jgi:hypothetical protein
MATIIEAGFTGNAPGTGPAVHEDLSDLLSVVDNRNTPLTSMMPKGRSLAGTATTIHWQADAKIEPSTTGWIDGTDINLASPGTNAHLTDTKANRRVLKNNVQSFKRAFRVAELVDTVVNPAGVRNELAHGISELILTQKRDIEKTVSSKNSAVEGDATTAFQTKGMGSFLDEAGTCQGTPSEDPALVPDGYRVRGGNTASGSHRTVDDAAPAAYYDGAKSAFTEEKVQDLLEGIYLETGTRSTYDVICSPSVKRKFTSFGDLTVQNAATANENGLAATVVRTLNKDQGSDALIANINLYEGDFGTLRLHTSNWMPLDDVGYDSDNGLAYVLDVANMTELRFAKTTNVKPLTDNGGGPGRVVGSIVSLVVKNPSACGRIGFSS